METFHLHEHLPLTAKLTQHHAVPGAEDAVAFTDNNGNIYHGLAVGTWKLGETYTCTATQAGGVICTISPA